MQDKVIIIGAGAGGLAAAIRLSRVGLAVTLLERHDHAGGKIRHNRASDTLISNGPTVCTMRHVADDLLREGGLVPEDEVRFIPASRLARHAWLDGTRLDLFQDQGATYDAIEQAFGRFEADGYLRFSAQAGRIADILRHTFMMAPKTGAAGLATRIGLHRPRTLLAIQPFRQLIAELGTYFRDPRLIQLFGRYATYVGSSPFLAPATLMLIVHVEQEGVWLVEGGMPALASALLRAAEKQGTVFRNRATVRNILVSGGRVCGVELENGDRLSADRVIFNGDAAALSGGLLGADVQKSVPPLPKTRRSLSAITLCAQAETSGFPLDYHTVLFGDDYAEEFSAIFRRREICRTPTVYVCAEDRLHGEVTGPERLFCLINAPADGDLGDPALTRAGYPGWLADYLGRFGLSVDFPDGAASMTFPADFDDAFPGAGGALYGAANHGPFDSFARPGSRARLPGLYLAGGSAHPGAGVPMALISGMLAADAVIQDMRAG